VEYLDDSPSPTDESALEKEAEAEYPYSLDHRGGYIDNEFNYRQTHCRRAYLTGRRKTIEQKDGEIEALKAKIVSLEEELALYRLEK
jgi:hypothetical protein